MNDLINYIINYISENIFLLILGVLTFYQTIYLIIGFISKKNVYEKTDVFKKYAVVIAARNEEKVIGKLIDSLKNQSYNKDLYDIFVVADNCTDDTARIAEEHGAIVYKRFNDQLKRKGWALEHLFEQIKKDYGITSYDGYIFFDADNLVDHNYIHEINKAFVKKGNIVVGYRNVKNFDTNIISSAYGIHFYRSIVTYHRPRSKLGFGTHIAGTGFVIDSNLIKDGWPFHGLTEDTELTLHFASKDIKVSFCEDAIFYDEQPIDFKTAYRQRVRWTKGRFDAFVKYFPKLLVRSFSSFTNYDLMIYAFPWPFYSLLKILIIPIFSGLIALQFLTGNFWLDTLKVFMATMGSLYLSNFLTALLVVIRERKSIHTIPIKKFFAALTYPWFNLITIFLAISVILNPKIQWTQIKHVDNRSIQDIKK